MTSVGLATCREFPNLDDDDRLVIPALAAVGIAGVPAVWTDSTVDWSAFDAVVIRGTWDYADDRDGYLAWIRGVERVTRLFNSGDVVEWNTDKHYLHELRAAGLPVVPTRFVEPADSAEDWLPGGEFTDVVVKPAVSCGSRDTVRYALHEPVDVAAEHVRRLLEESRSVMVQPYLDAVDTVGETALLFFDGEFSHSIRKGPLLARGVEGEKVEGLFVREQIDPREPSDDERAVAEAVVAQIPGDVPLYARVDLIPDTDGSPVILELELTEPSLFLSFSGGAPDRLARAIASRL